MLESAELVVTEPMCSIHWEQLIVTDAGDICPSCSAQPRKEPLREIGQWWPALPPSARRWLLENHREPLTPDVLTGLVLTRGYAPAAVRFGEAGDPDSHNFFLTDDESNWIAEHGRATA